MVAFWAVSWLVALLAGSLGWVWLVCCAVLAWIGRSVGASSPTSPILPLPGLVLHRAEPEAGPRTTKGPTGLGFGSWDLRAEGRRTLSWLIVLAVLRWSVLLAVVEAVGIVRLLGLCKSFRLSRDLPAACDCLSVRCVVARVCGCRALRCCRCWSVWVPAVCVCGCPRKADGTNHVPNLIVGWALGGALVSSRCRRLACF